MNSPLKQKLINAAITANDFAFHPITDGTVGAALLTTEDEIFHGCNVQTTIAGLGCCAEQCAIYNAVVHGKYNFKAIAVYYPKERFLKPCGCCLQLLNEFAQLIDKDIEIIMVNKEMKVKTTTVFKELTDAYGPRVAGKNIAPYQRNRQ
ncbi:MAG: cytidine deaminase [archaeon]